MPIRNRVRSDVATIKRRNVVVSGNFEFAEKRELRENHHYKELVSMAQY
jgi:hypothetical protein